MLILRRKFRAPAPPRPSVGDVANVIMYADGLTVEEVGDGHHVSWPVGPTLLMRPFTQMTVRSRFDAWITHGTTRELHRVMFTAGAVVNYIPVHVFDGVSRSFGVAMDFGLSLQEKAEIVRAAYYREFEFGR